MSVRSTRSEPKTKPSSSIELEDSNDGKFVVKEALDKTAAGSIIISPDTSELVGFLVAPGPATSECINLNRFLRWV